MTSGTNGGFLHAAFGLRLRSPIVLPELPPLAEDGRAADVVLELGPVPARLEGAVGVDPAMQVAANRFQLDVPAGRFRVSDGRRIRVDPSPAASEADLRPYLLGTVMGALCHQRAFLPLHAAAVVIGDGAVAFAGPSGAGKSTLAAQFRDRGVLADDLLALAVGPRGPPQAMRGLSRIRLRIGATGGREAKLSLPVEDAADGRVRPLRRVYLLQAEGGDPPSIRRLRGPEAVSALLGQIYRWPIALAMGRGAAALDQSAAVARNCEIFELGFTHAAVDPLAMTRVLEAHLAS